LGLGEAAAPVVVQFSQGFAASASSLLMLVTPKAAVWGQTVVWKDVLLRYSI
jgi:hypothetical protein